VPADLNQIVGLYENTRLGRQEIYAEFLETTEGVWFANFDPARHVAVEAEFHPGYFVRCAIDAGTSRHTAAVFFQVRQDPTSDIPRVTVFADYHARDVVSQKNARAIEELARQFPCRGRIDFPADGHPEEDLLDALRGGIRDAMPNGLAPRPNLRPVHASRIMG
jgi:hypothetical protein